MQPVTWTDWFGVKGDNMSMAQQYASYLERESHKAATPVKAEAMRQAANKLYELDREVDRLRGIEHRIEDAISVDVDVVVPARDYATMTPKDCYEAGMLDGGTAVREAIRAALTPNAKVTGSPALSASPCGLPGWRRAYNEERKSE